ncbi:MAG: sulfatase [Bacteroidota bacterium]
MKTYLLAASALLLFACQSSVSSEQELDKSPNIILIIADDMNWDDCGAYGHPHIQTPHIDKLAEEGMRFDRAYITASSCSPSRASIIMGRYPHNTGAEQLHWAIPPASYTFVKELKEAGYFTAAAGKWHMGEHIRPHFDLIYEANKAGFQLPTGKEKEAPKMIAQQPSGCEDWIRSLKSRPKDQPFFMWFAALDPHRAYEDGALDTPHQLSDVIVPPHLPEVGEVKEDLRLYYDEIGRLDSYVGKVLAEIKAQGIEDNTLIIFLSDNGRPFPRDKTTLYEGGIKTPFIVKWPAKVQAGISTSSLISSVDIAPTLFDLLGLAPASQFEGKSFYPLLLNSDQESRKYVFAEDHWHDYEDHARAVLNQNWKLIRNDYVDLAATPSADAGRSLTFQAMLKLKEQNKLTQAQLACFQFPRPRYELFNLQKDPYELHNLADDPAYAKVKDELLKALEDWSMETGDYIPSKRTPDEFDRLTGEPDHSVRKRPRPDKRAMFGTYGKY